MNHRACPGEKTTLNIVLAAMVAMVHGVPVGDSVVGRSGSDATVAASYRAANGQTQTVRFSYDESNGAVQGLDGNAKVVLSTLRRECTHPSSTG